MKRGRAIGAVLVAFGLLCGYLLYGYLQEPAYAGPDFSSWDPSAAAIRSKIGSQQSPTPGLKDTERRNQFCDMFKARFRRHDPALAVGLRFLTPTRIKLMCPARMEPFLIDRIALAAWHEARDSFGKGIDVDMYATFIGTSQIKIGELRPVPATPEVAHITYDFTSLDLLNRPRTWIPNSRGRLKPVLFRNVPPSLLNRHRPPVL